MATQSKLKMIRMVLLLLLPVIGFCFHCAAPFQSSGSKALSPLMAKTEDALNQPWLPLKISDDDPTLNYHERRGSLEQKSIEYLASLIRFRLHNKSSIDFSNDISTGETKAMRFAKNRFKDFTCTYDGEQALESLFDTRQNPELHQDDENIIRGAIIALLSLLVMGMRTGVKGSKEQIDRMFSHLKISNDELNDPNMSLDRLWISMQQRSLKHKADTTAGVQLLAALKKKRTNQSAYDLLFQLKAWTKHEDIALLRSGFPTRFTREELIAATTALECDHDPDSLLGLRKDFRHMKVYTIDGADTYEIDDGLSVEKYIRSDGSEARKIWIHISDADRWAPRDSEIFKVAEERVTSLYLPTGSVPMFPPELSAGPMSLRAGYDSYAISLGLELNEDGSIDASSLEIAPSLLHVSYRLTYHEVDEMLEFGVGYFEEWELGSLLDAAKLRRAYRIRCGSTEGFVPNPIPKAELKVVPSDDLADVNINKIVEVTHNAGLNSSSVVLDSSSDPMNDFGMPVSSSFMLVTEMMVMAGEAMGKLKEVLESTISDEDEPLKLSLNLPFRTQPRPDFRKRYEEFNTLESLRGKGYCHAWFARRFFEPVQVQESPQLHCGLGLECYVQWSSPIRRFGDLQVHASIKRFLRKRRVNQLLRLGHPIPSSLKASDLGCAVPLKMLLKHNNCLEQILRNVGSLQNLDDINYRRGIGFVNAARVVQKKSEEYWMYELIRRTIEHSEMEVVFDAEILACVDPVRKQYAIYLHGWGFEHKYLSEKGELILGEVLSLRVSSVNPRLGLLTFSLSSKYGGKPVKFVAQAA